LGWRGANIKKLIKKPTKKLKLKKLTEEQLKKVSGGIGWPSHAAAN